MSAADQPGGNRVREADLRLLEADARAARDQAAAYRARMMGRNEIQNDRRMRHLEHVQAFAAERLRRALEKEE